MRDIGGVLNEGLLRHEIGGIPFATADSHASDLPVEEQAAVTVADVPLYFCFLALDFRPASTRARRLDADTPKVSQRRNSISTVGDFLSCSSKLMYERSISAAKESCSCVNFAAIRAFRSSLPNIPAG